MNSKKTYPWMIGFFATFASMMVLQSNASAQCDPQQTAKLLASNGSAGAEFGWSVSVSGDKAVAGSPDGNGRVGGTGSAYVYEKVDGVWTFVSRLDASDGAFGDYFGGSVSICGDTVVVGAPGDDDSGGASGSVYVFDRIGGAWTQVAKLLPSDGNARDWFGGAVSISGDTLVVGADSDDAGSAYVFERAGGAWTQVAKLLPSGGYARARFGCSVSIDGDTAVIGASNDDDLGNQSGSAYVFQEIGGDWKRVARLLASDGAARNYFGGSVSISGDTAIVGAGGNGTFLSSAYAFEMIDGVWIQVAELLASDGAAGDRFGRSVSIDGDRTVVSAYGVGGKSGAAYVFEKIGAMWTQTAKFFPSDGAAFKYFGYWVSISGGTSLVGAFGDDWGGEDTGSAYVFDLNCGPEISSVASCPSGGPIQVSWDGATPNGQVVLIFARNEGPFTIPNNRPCAGTQLGLGSSQIQIAYRGSAGVDGSRTINATAGPAACGGYLQLLDLSTCETSNVAPVK